MEEFGARSATPLETCLSQVEECDVYVGIIAFRRGSVESKSGKPFTRLEYERAAELRKEVLIYLADEDTACFPYSQIDKSPKERGQIDTFKELLRECHTVQTFSTPEDLAEKIGSDLRRYLNPRTDLEPSEPEPDEFDAAQEVLTEFQLTPKRLNGREIRLKLTFDGSLHAAPRALCQHFNLEYGNTIFTSITIIKPGGWTRQLKELYATGKRIDDFRAAARQGIETDVYVCLQFTEHDIGRWKAEFFGSTYYLDEDYSDEDPRRVYVQPEGKVILLFSKLGPRELK